MNINTMIDLIVDSRDVVVADKNASAVAATAKEALENLLEVIRIKVDQVNKNVADRDLAVLDPAKLGQLEREQIGEVLAAIDAGNDADILRAAGRLKSLTEKHRPRETIQENEVAAPVGKVKSRAKTYVAMSMGVVVVFAAWFLLANWSSLPWTESPVDNGPGPLSTSNSSTPRSQQALNPPPSQPAPAPSGAAKSSQQPVPIDAEHQPTFDVGRAYRVLSPVNGGCLGYREGYPLTIHEYCRAAQLFRIAPVADGYRFVDAARPDYCLAPDDGRTVHVDSATTRIACDDPAAGQGLVWDIEPVLGDHHRIRNRLNSGMCLTAKLDGPSTSGKPAPRFYECSRQDLQERQRWLFQ